MNVASEHLAVPAWADWAIAIWAVTFALGLAYMLFALVRESAFRKTGRPLDVDDLRHPGNVPGVVAVLAAGWPLLPVALLLWGLFVAARKMFMLRRETTDA